MTALVRIALSRPYTFVVLALLILIIGIGGRQLHRKREAGLKGFQCLGLIALPGE